MVLIRPEVRMYSAFARLNYRPWYALAEFVDNSLQSALSSKEALREADGADYRLRVDIDINDDAIEIRDNAGGIALSEYDRAFLPAAPPEDSSGLSEFGLGMKAAASWFARHWSVRTTALGDPVERTITFDIPTIVATNCEELNPECREIPAGSHFTNVLLTNLQVRPQGRTVGKIKEHLSGIYRLFLRDGFLVLRLNGEPLFYEEPTCLEAPYHRTPIAEPVTWRKEISLDLGDGHGIRGWAGILARASVANAGFALFRRGRVIQGSHGDGYRPEKIFGSPNKFVYQRLVGELEVLGFGVSHTKDGIQWEDWEEDVQKWLRAELDLAPLPLIDQAANYRARAISNRDSLRDAVHDTGHAIAQHLPAVVDHQVQATPDETPFPPQLEPAEQELARSEQVMLELEHAHRHWSVQVELVCDEAREAWYEIANDTDTEDGSKEIAIRVNLSHPFMRRFTGEDGDDLIPFIRLATGLSIAEITAAEVGVRQAGTVRMNLSEILRSALSGPIERQVVADD